MAKLSILFLGMFFGFILSSIKPSWPTALNELTKKALKFAWEKIQFWK